MTISSNLIVRQTVIHQAYRMLMEIWRAQGLEQRSQANIDRELYTPKTIYFQGCRKIDSQERDFRKIIFYCSAPSTSGLMGLYNCVLRSLTQAVGAGDTALKSPAGCHGRIRQPAGGVHW
jgi:hypothetical protein